MLFNKNKINTFFSTVLVLFGINYNSISYSSEKNNSSYTIAYSDCKENFLSQSKTATDILEIAHPTASYYSSYASYDSSYAGYILNLTYRSGMTDKLLNMKILIKYSNGFLVISRILSDQGWIPAFLGFDSVVYTLMTDIENDYNNSSEADKSYIAQSMISLWKSGKMTGQIYTSGFISMSYSSYSCN